jgi:dinuclear metal center YbgI/SA1388 family protein
MRRNDLVEWLDDYLHLGAFNDISLNGLQVEGAEEVRKVAVAVDGSLSTFERAVALGAQLLLVHHGLFWGKPLAIRGMHGARVRYMLEHNLNLYAAHIPLDAHREVGNNWGLAHILGMTELEDFGAWRGKPMGVKGVFPESLELETLTKRLEEELGTSLLVHAGGKPEVRTLGIISGGAAWDVVTAAEEGLDAFLTGEPKHEVYYEAFERGINALYAGHYGSETVGVKLLGRKLEDVFGLETEFISLPTGL